MLRRYTLRRKLLGDKWKDKGERMVGKFSEVAATEQHKDWEALIARPEELYSKAGDIRSPFARDFTRVLHSLAYRRLKHKTQVFFNAAGNDHICTRMEHVQHVESVSMTIAKALGLNEELTKAIAMAHDLGHAPFGHQGEKILRDICKEHLDHDFWHEQNGVYLVDHVELLENQQRQYMNLSLAYAVRDGIISHCGELDNNAIRPREELFDLAVFDAPGKYEAATWEGCVVKLADKIAYLGRDIEDAIRLGYLNDVQLKELQEIVSFRDEVAVNTTGIMHAMIIDLCNNSSPEDGLRLSEEMSEKLNQIKAFNYAHIYKNKRLNPFNKYAELVINELFNALMEYYELYGQEVIFKLQDNRFDGRKFVEGFVHWLIQYCDFDYAAGTEANEIAKRCINKKIYGTLQDKKTYAQAVVDFIAGMTDGYTVSAFEELLRC